MQESLEAVHFVIVQHFLRAVCVKARDLQPLENTVINIVNGSRLGAPEAVPGTFEGNSPRTRMPDGSAVDFLTCKLQPSLVTLELDRDGIGFVSSCAEVKQAVAFPRKLLDEDIALRPSRLLAQEQDIVDNADADEVLAFLVQSEVHLLLSLPVS